MERPKMTPRSTPAHGPIPKPHYLPHPWTRPTYDAKRHAAGSDPPFFHNALDRQTNGQMDRPTDRPFTGKFDDYRPLRYESNAA